MVVWQASLLLVNGRHMDWNSLSSNQQKAFANILASSCSPAEIDQAIARSFKPSDRLAALTARNRNLSKQENFRAQLNELVRIASDQSRLQYFVREIRRIKVGYVAFRNLPDLLQVTDLTVTVSGTPGFEFQGAANRLGIVDFEALLKRMAEIKEATCRFIVSDQEGGAQRASLGTGVLVGEDLVLTNHHVLRDYIRHDFSGTNAPPPATLRCEFDYSGSNGALTSVALADQNWVVDLSPEGGAAQARGQGAPPPDPLDYALVRLATRAPPAGGKQREFETPLNVTTVDNGLPVMVVHYPGQHPLSASFGKTVGMHPNDTRVHYDADTEKGTSGSGVYRLPDCSLICLHQGADRSAGFNQGIPIGLILEHRQRSMV